MLLETNGKTPWRLLGGCCGLDKLLAISDIAFPPQTRVALKSLVSLHSTWLNFYSAGVYY